MADEQPIASELVDAIPNLRAFAASLCGDPHLADDLVQDTLFKAWSHRERYEEGSNIKAWLFTILRNTYFTHYRKSAREQLDGDEIASSIAVAPSQLLETELRDVVILLQELPADRREALLLIAAEGFSYDQAAAISGCAVGTMKSRVNRARRQLVALLEGDDFDSSPDLQSPSLLQSRPENRQSTRHEPMRQVLRP